MQVYSNELYHYGVVGMKWGVRRYQDYNGKIIKRKTAYSPFDKKDRASIVSSRLDQLSNDKARMERMSIRQRDSLNKAKKYWDSVAKGETPTVKRNIIKRSFDKSRAYDAKTRVARSAVSNVITQSVLMLYTNAVAKKGSDVLANMGMNLSALGMGYEKPSAGQVFKNVSLGAARDTAYNTIGSELAAKIFGHY